MPLDTNSLLAPCSADAPCGVNCEYDPLYLELETLALGTPETVMGDNVIPGDDPDWRGLRKNCLELWGRTRDLRVAVYLSIASLALEGLPGFASGLKLLENLVTEHWAGCWPALDPDDDNDPTERVNIVQMLSPDLTSFGDQMKFIALLRNVKLAEGLPWRMRDLLIANGVIESDRPVDGALLNAEMSGVPVSRMSESLEVVRGILATVRHIADAMNTAMADSGYVNFDALEKELKAFERFYSLHAQTPDAEEAPAAAPEAAGQAGAAPQVYASAVPAAAPARSVRPAGFTLAEFHPANRAEALLLLKKSAEYFQTAEPTSPVPFLINRALRMAEMNFIDLLGEIDANALERGREQLGVPKPKDESGW